MPRDDGSVLDIVLACRDIEEFVVGYDEERFLRSKRTRYAVMHQIMIIGEATKRVSDAFRDAYPEIPWKAMAGMRDRLIHGYDGVDLGTVWKVATSEVPMLRMQLEPLVLSDE
jgi:uncharacterized protein with HEPN domain